MWKCESTFNQSNSYFLASLIFSMRRLIQQLGLLPLIESYLYRLFRFIGRFGNFYRVATQSVWNLWLIVYLLVENFGCLFSFTFHRVIGFVIGGKKLKESDFCIKK